jgi:hypothetical protein
VAAYALNDVAVRHAKRLIDARQYVLRSRWQNVQPRAKEQNAYLKTHPWDEYAAWHLGLTEGAPDEAKARYAFVYGDFRRLHRMGLIACHYRAAEWGTRRSSWQPTSSCNTSIDGPPDEAARWRPPILSCVPRCLWCIARAPTTDISRVG